MHAPPTTAIPMARSRRPVRAWLAAGLLLLMAVSAGCGTVRAFTDTIEALEDEGFSKVQVNVAGGDPVALTVKADGPPGESTDEAHRIASELVWDEFPRRFDEARISIDGDRQVLTRGQLQERFGDRPEGLDDQDLGDDVNRIGLGLVLTVLLASVLVVAVVGLVTLLLVRSSRRSPRSPSRPSARLPAGTGPAPWAPPPGAGSSGAAPGGPGLPAGSPVPPAGGWAPADPAAADRPWVPAWNDPPTAPGGAEPGAPAPGTPSDGREPGAPPEAAPRAPWPAEPPAGEAVPPHGESKADRRRLGRPARGPRPPAGNTPPGWG